VRIRDMFLTFADWKRNFGNLLRSSVIGTAVGILPGIGANIASAVAYTMARNASKHPEKFGTGIEEGIIASESANHASVGGALVPLIAMGIPGSIIDAFLLGAMMMQSITPGTLLFANHPELVMGMMGSYLVSVLMMFVIMMISSKYIARLCLVPRSYLLPVILVFCVVGAFANRNDVMDVWIMLGFGVVGFVLEKCRIPLAPFVMGVILAPIAEAQLRSGLMISAGSVLPIFTRPMSLAFVVVSVLLLVWQLNKEVAMRRRTVMPMTGAVPPPAEG
jgi:putative tricarboxylic transport membrane protein